MTDAELIAYYAALLIIQYADKPKAAAMVSAFVDEAVANQIVQQVQDGFDLATAIGAQLDALGSYRGVNRQQFGLTLDKAFFAMPPASDPDLNSYKGFALAADVATIDWFFELAADYTAPSLLNDSEMRVFIEYLAALQSCDLTLGSIDAILFEFFGNYVTLTDNGDMTITYTDAVDDPSNLFKIVNFTGTLPAPAGVEIIVST